MPTIRIPTPLRPYAANTAEVPVTGETVGAALSDLTVRHPDLRRHLYTDTGDLRAFVNVFLGQEDVRYLQGVNTPLEDADQLRIVPSVAGGLCAGCFVYYRLNRVNVPGFSKAPSPNTAPSIKPKGS